jgi:hypothetical protein
MSQSPCITKIVDERAGAAPVLKTVAMMIRRSSTCHNECLQVSSTQSFVHIKAETYHDIQTDDQHDLQTRKCELKLSIYPHKEEVTGDDQKSKHCYPNPTAGLIPELDNNSRCRKLGREGYHCSIHLIPTICERQGGVDKVFGVTDDRSTQRNERTFRNQSMALDKLENSYLSSAMDKTTPETNIPTKV